MKKKIILVFVATLLILIMALSLVACSNKNRIKENEFVFNDGMTSAQIFAQLFTKKIDNLTYYYDYDGVNYEQRASGNGYVSFSSYKVDEINVQDIFFSFVDDGRAYDGIVSLKNGVIDEENSAIDIIDLKGAKVLNDEINYVYKFLNSKAVNLGSFISGLDYVRNKTIKVVDKDTISFTNDDITFNITNINKTQLSLPDALSSLKTREATSTIDKYNNNTFTGLKYAVETFEVPSKVNEVNITNIAIDFGKKVPQKLIIPTTITSINIGDIATCTSVVYKGTVEQFKSVTINGSVSQNATIFCSDNVYVIEKK